MDDYDERISQLVEHVSVIYRREKDNELFISSLSKERQTLSRLIKHLESSLEIMRSDNIELSLEDDYSNEIDGDSASYKKLCYDIECLKAVAAAHKRKKYPKFALKYAALGYLLIRWTGGKNAPSLYDQGADIQEYKSLCERAGLSLSNEAYRSALSKGLKEFDRHLYMPEYEYLYK